jgi:hypothetical protein
MTQLITGIGIDFPSGIVVADIVRVMLKDNWPLVASGFKPGKEKITFTDMGWSNNRNYQISTKQRPYRIASTSGSGSYQHIEAEVEINLFQRFLKMRKPPEIEDMMRKVSEIVQTNRKNLQTGIIDPAMQLLASGMDSITMSTEFDEPGVDTIQMQLKPAGTTSVWHTQGYCMVRFFRYVA